MENHDFFRPAAVQVPTEEEEEREGDDDINSSDKLCNRREEQGSLSILSEIPPRELPDMMSTSEGGGGDGKATQ